MDFGVEVRFGDVVSLDKKRRNLVVICMTIIIYYQNYVVEVGISDDGK